MSSPSQPLTSKAHTSKGYLSAVALVSRIGARRGFLGNSRQAPVAHLAKIKRRRVLLPTIVEEDCEDAEEEGATGASVYSLTRESYTLPVPFSSCFQDVSLEPLCLDTDPSFAESLAEQLKVACSMRRWNLLAWISPALSRLATSKCGSHVVQCAVKVAAGTERMMLIHHFHGSVVDLSMSPHGYQVLATLIETMPVSALDFVTHELSGRAGEVARNRFGYRILEAATMHCSEEQMAGLSIELASDTIELSRHMYGNSVIQHLLEYGSEACRSAVIQHLKIQVFMLAMDRTASGVVAKALECVEDRERCEIAMALLQPTKYISLADVACSRPGSAILVQISTIESCRAEVRILLATATPRLMRTKFGRRVADQFGLIAQSNSSLDIGDAS
jgi:hypothetical protein